MGTIVTVLIGLNLVLSGYSSGIIDSAYEDPDPWKQCYITVTLWTPDWPEEDMEPIVACDPKFCVIPDPPCLPEEEADPISGPSMHVLEEVAMEIYCVNAMALSGHIDGLTVCNSSGYGPPSQY